MRLSKPLRSPGATHRRVGKEAQFINVSKQSDIRPAENSGKRWTPQAIHELKLLARANTPAELIAFELQRTEESIRAIAARHGISLKPE